jgi:hypothetical protein
MPGEKKSVDFETHLAMVAKRYGLVEHTLREAVRAELTRQAAGEIVERIVAGRVGPPEPPQGGTWGKQRP